MIHPLLTTIKDILCLIFLPHSKQQRQYDEAFKNRKLSNSEPLYHNILFDPRPYTIAHSQQNEAVPSQHVAEQLLYWDNKRVTQSLHNREVDEAIMQDIKTNALPPSPLTSWEMYRLTHQEQPIRQELPRMPETAFHKTMLSPLVQEDDMQVEDLWLLDSTPVEVENVEVVDMDATMEVPAIMRLRHGA